MLCTSIPEGGFPGEPPEGGMPGGFGGNTPPGGGSGDFEYTAATEITEATDEAFECIWQGLLAIAENYPRYCQCWRG